MSTKRASKPMKKIMGFDAGWSAALAQLVPLMQARQG